MHKALELAKSMCCEISNGTHPEPRGRVMNYWIFIVTTHKVDGEILSSDGIFRQRMADKFWGLGEDTKNRSSLRKGDRAVFYVGTPSKLFAGSAVLASDSWELSEEERERVSHGKNFYRAEYGVQLESVETWDRPRSAESLVPYLKFIEKKEFWGTYLQGGVRAVSEEDFRTIILGPETIESPKQPSQEELHTASEFALETHLEEFMDKNWDSIDFGIKLARYQTEEQSGRQFPAGEWSIDFLCTDVQKGDLVVVELKRGKTSDSTVGQVLRYAGWVRKHLAKDGQRVRGLIIAREVDEALSYAVRDLDDVSVLTYRVDFKLSPFKR